MDQRLATQDSTIPVELAKTRVALQRRGTGHLEVCNTVSGIGREGEETHYGTVAHRDDDDPSPNHRLGKEIYDAPRMCPAPGDGGAAAFAHFDGSLQSLGKCRECRFSRDGR